MDILSDNVVKTRKEHRCDACCRKFQKGTQMRTQVVVDSGQIGTYRTCPTCTELLSKYPNEFMNCDNCFEPWCVKEMAEGLSPEDLLDELKIKYKINN